VWQSFLAAALKEIMTQIVMWVCSCAVMVATVAAQDPNAVGVVSAPAPISGHLMMPGAVAVTTTIGPALVNPLLGALTQVATLAGGTPNPNGVLTNNGVDLLDPTESMESAQFIDGFISAYLERVDLDPGEKACLRDDMKKMGQHGVQAAKEMVKMISQFMHQGQPGADAGSEVLTGMSAIGEVMSIVSRVQMLGQGCVQDDTMNVLKASLNHLKNVTYVQTRLQANGIDIMRVVADAAPQIRAKNFYNVGKDFGTMLRKILLSSNNVSPKMVLPNGMTKDDVGPLIMNGIIQGFFVMGTTLTITMANNPNVMVYVDMHECIAKEAKYFSSAMNALYLFVAEISTDIEEWKLQSEGIQVSQGNTNKMAWLGQLSGLMANVPTLMQRCGMTSEQMEDLATALQHMDQMNIALNIPGPVGDQAAAGVEASAKVAQATEYWEVGNYLFFGEMLGESLRDMLLAVDPQLWTVENGLLKRRRQKPRGIAASLPLLVGAIAAVSFTGLSLLRVVQWNRRASPHFTPHLNTEGVVADMEACDADDMAVE
jgi:hypothetical protein